MAAFVTRDAAYVLGLPTPREAREAVAKYAGPEGLIRLGKRINRAPSTIVRIERGYIPPDEIIRRLATALGCSYDVFMFNRVSRRLTAEYAADPLPLNTSGRPAMRRLTKEQRTSQTQKKGSSRNASPQSSDARRAAA